MKSFKKFQQYNTINIITIQNHDVLYKNRVANNEVHTPEQTRLLILVHIVNPFDLNKKDNFIQ